MKPASLAVLARRLAAAGFAPECVGYPSVRGGPLSMLEPLGERLRDKGQPVHLVGHSLGGVLAVHLSAHYPDQIGRVVCLGSPLLGSRSALGVASLPGGRRLLGDSSDVLRGLTACPDGSSVGMIAGSRRLGLGALLARLPGVHDGTVAVEETQLPGLLDHCVVGACHSELPFSPMAAKLAAQFLRTGRFAEAELAPAEA